MERGLDEEMKRQWQAQLHNSVVSEEYKGRSWRTKYWQEERIKVNTLETCLIQTFNLFPAGFGEVTAASKSLANRAPGVTKLRGCFHRTLCCLAWSFVWIMAWPFARHSSKHLRADWLINSRTSAPIIHCVACSQTGSGSLIFPLTMTNGKSYN